MSDATKPPPALARPQVSLDGDVGDAMARDLSAALRRLEDGDGPVAVEVSTFGGDADVARRMVSDLRLFRGVSGRRLLFLGKGAVYSAGATLMSGFLPEDRWLTRETTLLIHGRSLSRSIDLKGPLEVSQLRLQSVIAEIEQGLALERDDFARLIAGSPIELSEISRRARAGWFVSADEALSLGLIAGVV